MKRAVSRELASPDPRLEADIRRRLDEVEVALRDGVQSDTRIVAEAGAHLLEAGGKRFRPMLVLLGGYFGDPHEPRLVRAAVAIELAHLATLYHDEVIDEADSRRGIASVNARWDNTVAILTGDFLFARASEVAADLGADVIRLLAHTIGQVTEGQIREVEAAGRIDIDQETYLGVISRKTASLIATSCRVGGMAAGAPGGVIEILERFGRALGMAFQLSDDIMDLIADEATLGKEPGVDLREGVFTLPVIQALQGSEHRDELRQLLGEPSLDGERFARVIEIVRGDSALDGARRAVAAEVRRALAEAGRLPSGAPRDTLEHLARFLADRCGATT